MVASDQRMSVCDSISPGDVWYLLGLGIENDAELEIAWAKKAFKFAETHYNLLRVIPDVKLLRLTPYALNLVVDGVFLTFGSVDEDIYQDFRKTFPDLRVDVVSEDELKSKEAKDLWRDLIMRFQERIEDFNYGTLLRADCAKDYTEENTILGIHFLLFATRSLGLLIRICHVSAPNTVLLRGGSAEPRGT